MLVNVVYGFLGAGKTTFIKYVMEHPPPGEKVVILVNEFGEVGVDGLILADQGGQIAEVVELPSGCICCTIASDFRRQVLDICERFNPHRMIVEPTGVATISQILQILEGEDLRRLYSDLSLIHILDGSEFLSFIRSHRPFIENQIRRSSVVLLNKVDRVKGPLVNLLVESVREINPQAQVFPTSFARLDRHVLGRVLHRDWSDATDMLYHDPLEDDHDHEEHEHGDEHGEEHDHGLAEQYQSYGRTFTHVFSRESLEAFFHRLNSRSYGDVVRAKGVFKTLESWIKLELASGEVRMDSGPVGKESVISIIGQGMNIGRIEAELADCLAK